MQPCWPRSGKSFGLYITKHFSRTLRNIYQPSLSVSFDSGRCLHVASKDAFTWLRSYQCHTLLLRQDCSQAGPTSDMLGANKLHARLLRLLSLCKTSFHCYIQCLQQICFLVLTREMPKLFSCHCSRSHCLLGPAWPQGHPTCWLHDVAAGRSVLLVQRLLATMERLLLLHRQLRSSLPLHPRQALPRRLPVTFRLKAVSMASSQRYTPQQSHFPFYCLFNGNSRSLQHCLWLFNGTIPSAHA